MNYDKAWKGDMGPLGHQHGASAYMLMMIALVAAQLNGAQAADVKDHYGRTNHAWSDDILAGLERRDLINGTAAHHLTGMPVYTLTRKGADNLKALCGTAAGQRMARAATDYARNALVDHRLLVGDHPRGEATSASR